VAGLWLGWIPVVELVVALVDGWNDGGGGEKLLERGLWKLVFCQLWTLFSPPPGHQTHLYL